MIKVEDALVPHRGMTHIAVVRLDVDTALPDDEVLASCGIIHPEKMDWTECPVASRWTLLRTARKVRPIAR